MAAAVGVGGLAMAYKGQKDQKKANAAANATNEANQTEMNRIGWSNYLMQRGMAPPTNIQPGVIPQAGQFKAVNTRMPLWMTLNRGQMAGLGKTTPPAGERRIVGYRRKTV